MNMVHCPNPACISNHEQVDDVFTLVDPDKGTYLLPVLRDRSKIRIDYIKRATGIADGSQTVDKAAKPRLL